MPRGRPSHRLTAVAGLVLLPLAGCSGLAEADGEGKTLILSLNQTETHPSYIALTEFGDDVDVEAPARKDILRP